MELTREQRDKRIAVCRDMLAQMDAAENALQISVGKGYVCWSDQAGAVDRWRATQLIGRDDDLQEHVSAFQKTCEVCIRGAALLSFARLYDSVPVKKVFDFSRAELTVSSQTTSDLLASVFDPLTLALMEGVFEATDQFATPEIDEYPERLDKVRAAALYGLRLTMGIRDRDERAKVRARAVCYMMIGGDGEIDFTPVCGFKGYFDEKCRLEAENRLMLTASAQPEQSV